MISVNLSLLQVFTCNSSTFVYFHYKNPRVHNHLPHSYCPYPHHPSKYCLNWNLLITNIKEKYWKEGRILSQQSNTKNNYKQKITPACWMYPICLQYILTKLSKEYWSSLLYKLCSSWATEATFYPIIIKTLPEGQ